jgi:hypothetical protein
VTEFRKRSCFLFVLVDLLSIYIIYNMFSMDAGNIDSRRVGLSENIEKKMTDNAFIFDPWPGSADWFPRISVFRKLRYKTYKSVK